MNLFTQKNITTKKETWLTPRLINYDFYGEFLGQNIELDLAKRNKAATQSSQLTDIENNRKISTKIISYKKLMHVLKNG
jgi:hypothetical protein